MHYGKFTQPEYLSSAGFPLIPGVGGDMVLSKHSGESFQFEFAGQVRRQRLKIIAESLEP
jgi:hypothetical protein